MATSNIIQKGIVGNMENVKVDENTLTGTLRKWVKILKSAKTTSNEKTIQKFIDKFENTDQKLVRLFKNKVISGEIDYENLKNRPGQLAKYKEAVKDKYAGLSLQIIADLSKNSKEIRDKNGNLVGYRGDVDNKDAKDIQPERDKFEEFVDFIESKNGCFNVATVAKMIGVIGLATAGVALAGFTLPAMGIALGAAALTSPLVFKKEFLAQWDRIKHNHAIKKDIIKAEAKEASKENIDDYIEKDLKAEELEDQCRQEATDLATKHYATDADFTNALTSFRNKYKDVPLAKLDEIMINAGLSKETPSAKKAFADLSADAHFHKETSAGAADADKAHTEFVNFKKQYEEVIKGFSDPTLSQADRVKALNDLKKVAADKANFGYVAGTWDKQLNERAEKVQIICEKMAESLNELMRIKIAGDKITNKDKKQALKNAGLDGLDFDALENK